MNRPLFGQRPLFGAGKSIKVPCTVEIEQTSEFLGAHVSLEGIEVEVGDTVQVHDAPGLVPFGEHQIFHRTATVTRASRLDQWLTKLSAYRELTELYEVGFDADMFAGTPTPRSAT
jgi:hypothetical protein